MAEIRSFSVGHCTHPACMVQKGAGLASRCFPSRAFLISTRAGLCLWDTGYARRFQQAVSSGVFRLYGWVTPVFFDESQSLVQQLQNHGVRPNDIRSVVMSHFHADHIAGLQDFPAARILCCSEGWKRHHDLRGLAALRRAFIPSLMPGDTESRLHFVQALPQRPLPPELAPFRDAWDLTGDGEVFIVPLPGHALGHLGAFVNTDTGWVLLASDAAWTPEAYRELNGPSELSFLLQDSRKEYYRTLEALQILHRRGVRIELSHVVPEVMP